VLTVAREKNRRRPTVVRRPPPPLWPPPPSKKATSGARNTISRARPLSVSSKKRNNHTRSKRDRRRHRTITTWREKTWSGQRRGTTRAVSPSSSRVHRNVVLRGPVVLPTKKCCRFGFGPGQMVKGGGFQEEQGRGSGAAMIRLLFIVRYSSRLNYIYYYYYHHHHQVDVRLSPLRV
jgi:hypothetical protein